MDEERSRVTKIGWALAYGSAIIVDVLEVFIGIILPGLGEGINLFINVVYGALLAFYLHQKGISMTKGKNLLRFLAAFGLDELTLGFAPGWTLDVWLTHRAVKKEEREREPSTPSGPLNKNGVRRPSDENIPANQNGVRSPVREIM